MSSVIRTLRFVAMLAVLSSCQAQVAPLSQANVAAIEETTQNFVKAVLAKDWATLANLYTDDAILLPPNAPMVKGRAMIQAWLEKFPPVTDFTLNSVQVDGRDDLAYVLGTFTMTIVPPGASGPIRDSGKYIEIRRRQSDGRWLISADIFNSDLPSGQ